MLVSGAVVGALVSFGVSGCAEEPDAQEASWTEPAWFAEQARQREEVALVLQHCMNTQGWDVPVDEYGGIDANLYGVPEAEEMIADVRACYAEIPPEYNVEVDAAYLRDVLYGQQVDIYECLVAHGFAPEPPPPVDVFVETYLDPAQSDKMWIAWAGPWVEEAQIDPDVDLAQLELDCPQPYVAP